MVELEIVRTYAAPRQLVWDAWTDPDQIALWWGPRGISTPRESIKIDLRPGGRMSLEMVDDAATTTLRIHIVADFTDDVRAGAEQGWGSQLDKLADFLTI
jgi:uncharacterized protein YndB with AHSA1/START domain